jgi:hypothetical protein
VRKADAARGKRRHVTGDDKAERNLASGGDAVIVRTLQTSNKKGKQRRKVPTPPVNQKLLPSCISLIFGFEASRHFKSFLTTLPPFITNLTR